MESVTKVLGRLDALRVELVDLAYELECRGRRDAADVALAVAGRVGEFHEELAGPAPRRRPTSVLHPS